MRIEGKDQVDSKEEGGGIEDGGCLCGMRNVHEPLVLLHVLHHLEEFWEQGERQSWCTDHRQQQLVI